MATFKTYHPQFEYVSGVAIGDLMVCVISAVSFSAGLTNLTTADTSWKKLTETKYVILGQYNTVFATFAKTLTSLDELVNPNWLLDGSTIQFGAVDYFVFGDAETTTSCANFVDQDGGAILTFPSITSTRANSTILSIGYNGAGTIQLTDWPNTPPSGVPQLLFSNSGMGIFATIQSQVGSTPSYTGQVAPNDQAIPHRSVVLELITPEVELKDITLVTDKIYGVFGPSLLYVNGGYFTKSNFTLVTDGTNGLIDIQDIALGYLGLSALPPVGVYTVVIREENSASINGTTRDSTLVFTVLPDPAMYVTSTTVVGSEVSLSGIQPGDLIIALASSTTSMPWTPQGWTSERTGGISNLSMNIATHIAQSTSISAIFTNASTVLVAVYRANAGYTLTPSPTMGAVNAATGSAATSAIFAFGEITKPVFHVAGIVHESVISQTGAAGFYFAAGVFNGRSMNSKSWLFDTISSYATVLGGTLALGVTTEETGYTTGALAIEFSYTDGSEPEPEIPPTSDTSSHSFWL